MRGLTLAALAAIGALLATPAGAARKRALHPPEETQVFTGTEESPPGKPPRPPAVSYWRVRMTMPVAASERAARVALLAPLSDARQDVLGRWSTAPGFRFAENGVGPNLRVVWRADATPGTRLDYEVAVRISDAPVAIPQVAIRRVPPSPDGAAALAASERIQATEPEIVRRTRTVIGGATQLDEVVSLLYQYTAAFRPAPEPPGPQDAASVIRAGRGTSLGRARALTALLRAAGVPARPVGGLRLANSTRKRATNSWVEVWTGTEWAPVDPTGEHLGALPNDYLTIYRGDLPLITHTPGLAVDYGFDIRETTRAAVESGAPGGGDTPSGVQTPPQTPVEMHTSYVTAPVASVVLIADQSVPVAVTDRILSQARDAAIDVVLLTARFESRYFRQTYLDRLVAANLTLIRKAHLVLVATADDAGVYALIGMGGRGARMPDSRIVLAGDLPAASTRMLATLLYDLVQPGELLLIDRPTDLLPLWEVARANLIDGASMQAEAARWGLQPLVLTYGGSPMPRWRRPLLRAWERIVRAEVPLGAITLILTLPVIATIVVAARLVIGLQTFGMFGPVIVSLAFLTTGLQWGTVIFVTIVGLGIALRSVLQRLRLQAVARVAILIGLVSAVMGGLTLVGATLGIGPLLHVSIFPMVIMSNVIENFAASQVELGTRQAVRMTLGTLLLAIVCYLAVDRSGLPALLIAYPELLLGTVLVDIALGKWRGIRLLEYARFWRAAGDPATVRSG